MDLFKPKPAELALLRQYVREVRLLDLAENQIQTINLSSEQGERLPPKKLVLEGKFEIGDVTPSAEDSNSRPGLYPFVSGIIVAQYERTWISHMMTCLNQPISLQLSTEQYYAEIAKQLGRACYGNTVILRFYEEHDSLINRDALLCGAIYDRRAVRRDPSIFNIEKGHSSAFVFYDEFASRFISDPTQVMVLHDDTSRDLFNLGKSLLRNDEIKTLIVTALSIGGGVSGFATFAYESRIELSRDLVLAFANITNHASAAIENFRKLEELHSLRNQQLREYIENLQYDLLQGFRHAARNALFAAKGHLRALASYYAYSGARAEDDPYKKITRNLGELDHALNNMASLKLIDENKEVGDISEVFDEACELMRFQLNEANVTVRKNVKGHLVLPLNRFAVKYAFANLMLNSIQAFSEHRKGDRQITFSGSRAGRDILVDISDNGPGIRRGHGDIQSFEDIWVAGKTSKKQGTGYGLPMVRDVFQRLHNGSINLRPSGQGASFRIKLRTELD